jgi:hypothetical protein
MRAGIYVRISTLDQHAANQLPELHKYVADRGWDAQEFVDRGVSGAKDCLMTYRPWASASSPYARDSIGRRRAVGYKRSSSP